jgi:hypothetical protein
MSTLGIENIEHTNGTSAMTVDTSGRIAMPKVPAFAVRGYGSIQNNATINGLTLAAGNDMIYNYTQIDINRDNAFDNSTGIYTVPVAGLYQIQGGFGYKSSSNYFAIRIYATTSDHSSYGYVGTWANNDNNHTGRQLATIVEATVGQQFGLAMSDQYSNPSNADKSYLWFSAYLIG